MHFQFNNHGHHLSDFVINLFLFLHAIIEEIQIKRKTTANSFLVLSLHYHSQYSKKQLLSDHWY